MRDTKNKKKNLISAKLTFGASHCCLRHYFSTFSRFSFYKKYKVAPKNQTIEFVKLAAKLKPCSLTTVNTLQ